MAAFSAKGWERAKKLCEILPQIDWECRGEGEPLRAFTERAFQYHLPLLFIGAAGIAIRAIAPSVKDKLTDSPVLVMDEKGQYVIPVLSGHAGGGNDLAVLIARAAGAQPVITTATDVEDLFSCDVFARRNFLFIHNREGIRRVSAKLLERGKISVFVQDKILLPDEEIPVCVELVHGGRADILISDAEDVPCSLWLSPKLFFPGIGCRKGKTFEELLHFADRTFVHGNWREKVAAVASIDKKRRERGLEILAQYEHLPLLTYTAQELEEVPGDFSSSSFVRKTVGVSNVCERAAVLAAGPGAELILPKTAQNGMTLAVAKAAPRLYTWNTEPGIGVEGGKIQ